MSCKFLVKMRSRKNYVKIKITLVKQRLLEIMNLRSGARNPWGVRPWPLQSCLFRQIAIIFYSYLLRLRRRNAYSSIAMPWYCGKSPGREIKTPLSKAWYFYSKVFLLLHSEILLISLYLKSSSIKWQ